MSPSDAGRNARATRTEAGPAAGPTVYPAMPRRTFRPLAPFHQRYSTTRPALGFTAQSRAEWVAWRDALRARTRCLLGLAEPGRGPSAPLRTSQWLLLRGPDGVPCALEAETLEVAADQGLVREKVVFQSTPYASVPAYVLRPASAAAPRPALIALHGHGGGAADVVGLAPTATRAEEVRAQEEDYPQRLARDGYVVLVPEQLGFGQRRDPADEAEGWSRSSCRRLALWAQMYGGTVLGLRVWEVMRCLDYLATRPEVDTSRIACVGHSGGGTVALFAAALEERIAVVVLSGCLVNYGEGVLDEPHCECQCVPGLLPVAELEDVAALLAPRPLLVEAGRRDPVFPAEAVQRAYAKLEQAYGLLEARDRLELALFDGGHRFDAARAAEFLARWLPPDP